MGDYSCLRLGGPHRGEFSHAFSSWWMGRIMLLVCEAHQNIYTLLQLLLLFGELYLCCRCAFAQRNIDAASPPFGASGDGPCDGLRCAASTDALRQRGGCSVCSIDG